MNSDLNRPKSFGEILDITFRLSKQYFKPFFTLLLLLLGPVYLLQAIFQMLSGISFFRVETSEGGLWFEEVIASFDPEATSTSATASFGDFIVAIASLVLYVIATAAIIHAINHIRKNETFTIGSIIKKAMTRFWPNLWSTLLVSIMTFGIYIVPLIIFMIFVFTSAMVSGGSTSSIVVSIIMGILLFIGLLLGVGLLLSRWGFYFALITFGEGAPALSKSWSITKKRTWFIFGLVVVFYLIITIVSTVFQLLLGMVLGNSVLYTMIINFLSLFIMMIACVGYSVLFFDLKARNDAGDLKDMLDEYNGSI